MNKLTEAQMCACGDHCFVPITNGFVALVSPEDKPLVDNWRWRAKINKRTVYARTSQGRRNTIIMHRLIMRAKGGCLIDHIDGNGLNNRRSNLRVATHLQNIANTVCQNKHGYKGVSFIPRCNKSRPWQAQIKADGRQRSLGYFETKEEAARAYDAAAEAIHGQFARLNFPRALEDGR